MQQINRDEPMSREGVFVLGICKTDVASQLILGTEEGSVAEAQKAGAVLAELQDGTRSA